ncbi:hypothetical protein Tco_0294483 [Tanacetum coccineum]
MLRLICSGNLESSLLKMESQCNHITLIFYKMMNEMIQNNLKVDTMQMNIQFLQQLQPEWSRFVTVVKQTEKLDTVSYHKLFNILKQYQNEVNEICAERIAKTANPLALVAFAQTYPDNYHQAPKPQRAYAPAPKQISTRHKGKEVAKPVTRPSESGSDEDSDPEQAQKDKEMQKNLALIAKYFKNLYKPTNNNLRTSSNSRNKTVDNSPRQSAKQGDPLQAEQAEWPADTNKEVDEQELEAPYSYMAKIHEVLPADSDNTAEPLEEVHEHGLKRMVMGFRAYGKH